SDEEKAAAEKARKQYEKLAEKYQSLSKEEARLAKAPKGETPEAKAEREKKLKEIQKKRDFARKEAEKLIPVVSKALAEYRQPTYTGHVGLFAGKAAKTAAAR